jgi:hypothetical protein
MLSIAKCHTFGGCPKKGAGLAGLDQAQMGCGGRGVDVVVGKLLQHSVKHRALLRVEAADALDTLQL